jgi:hypothetical protein
MAVNIGRLPSCWDTPPGGRKLGRFPPPGGGNRVHFIPCHIGNIGNNCTARGRIRGPSHLTHTAEMLAPRRPSS